MPNLFGDFVSDLANALIGDLGFLSSANIRNDYMMLEYIGEKESAQIIKNAINEVLKEGQVLTPDCNGHASTTEFSDEIINKIKATIK